MQEVIIDTSSMLFGISKKHDPFDALKERFPNDKIVISKGIERELVAISESGRVEAAHAKVALGLLQKYNVEILDDFSYADTFIENEAAHNNAHVCTNDAELKKRLKTMGIKAVSITISGKLR